MTARFLTGTNPVAAWLRCLLPKWSVRVDAYFFLRDDKESEGLREQRHTASMRFQAFQISYQPSSRLRTPALSNGRATRRSSPGCK